ncbi:hypothetical protein [Alteromonas confluentis]|uniref:Uncharacterized protein n=1 Tax=Alteromonas confluentis TaxID=1656094 RepID=A0A1E7ZE74_9ALTE|nr:hypothetical protein [Alteromonas confluentis]OFC71809.1 hypothetical protein BFC18_06545 [Alteromonas confluentis]
MKTNKILASIRAANSKPSTVIAEAQQLFASSAPAEEKLAQLEAMVPDASPDEQEALGDLMSAVIASQD